MNRIATGIIAGAAWLLLLYKNSFLLFWLVISILAAVALHEYFSMTTPAPDRKHYIFGIICGICPVLAAYGGRLDMAAGGLMFGLFFLSLLVLYRYSAISNALETLGKGNFGIILIGFCGAHLILIMNGPQGNSRLLLLTALIIASDTGAYYTGRTFGRTKLCPAISPGKTVEGFIGGIFAALITSITVVITLKLNIDPLTTGIIAVLLSTVGVIGDLTMSVIKRSAGVKDSGTILPGHGGLLDRIDSLLFAGPAFFYIIHFGLLNY